MRGILKYRLLLVFAAVVMAGFAMTTLLWLASADTRAQTPPSLTSVIPATVVNDTSHALTLTGSGFEATPTVTLGTLPLPAVGFVNTTTLTATLPAGIPAQVYTVTVTNPDGLTGTLPHALTVQNPAPVVLDVEPVTGTYGTTTELSITGMHFVATPTVTLGGVLCPVTDIAPSTTLTVAVPGALLPGVHDLSVTNPGPGAPSDTLTQAFTLYSPAPTVQAVVPAEGPNNLDVRLTITGTNFVPTPTVQLDDVILGSVSWISSTRLTAWVAWGHDPGTYDVTVINPGPGAISATLDQAFTLERAIGVWTTGGPYGGRIPDIAASPHHSGTAYAVAANVGLFRTVDGGDWWDLVADLPGIIEFGGVTYGPPPTSTLYVWSHQGGLRRSPDDGQQWEIILDEGVRDLAFTHDGRTLWVSTGADVHRSADGGQTWVSRRGNLPGSVFITHIAVHPTDEDTVYAATADSQIYKTTNGGTEWVLHSDGLPAPDPRHWPEVLAVHPVTPSIVLFSRTQDFVNALYRSTDGGANWQPITDTINLQFVQDLAFSPNDPATIYVGAMGEAVGVSHDAGATWAPLGSGFGGGAASLALDAATGLPRYAGGNARGTYRSHDGGITWEQATEGLAALQGANLAARPGDPGRIYAVDGDSDNYVSDNAGFSWRQLEVEGGDSIAVSPADPDLVYLGGGGIPPDFYRSLDNGESWTRTLLPFPHNGNVMAVAVHPVTPSIVYAGGIDTEAETVDSRFVGFVFRSDDHGETWSELSISQQISQVRAVVINPVTPTTLYAAGSAGSFEWVPDGAPGLGVFRSEDGGLSWSPVVTGLGHVQVPALAIKPDDPQILLAAVWNAEDKPATVYRSTDGGDSWMPTTLQARWGYWGGELVFDPLAPNIVYAGTEEGLWRSVDAGATWERAAGSLGQIGIRGLTAASGIQRTILYVSVVGELNTAAVRADVWVEEEPLLSGVYQYTVLHLPLTETVYIPLIMKDR